MNITLDQLQHAVRRCTPGAPPSYAERLWHELEGATGTGPDEDRQQRQAREIHGIYGRTLEDDEVGDEPPP